MRQRDGLLKKIIGSLYLPVGMYIIMYLLTHANGKEYFGTLPMWKTLIVNIAVTASVALGIGLQFKSGRFDFSGGAIMLLTAIVAGNIAKDFNSNVIIFSIVTLGLSVGLSLIVSLIYVYGRVRVIIATIGSALLFEAVTPLIFLGGGVKLVADMKLKAFSRYPTVFIPFLGAVVVYAFYNYFTVTGRQAVLLAHNQQAAYNIGINEKKNVILSYVFSGLIFGFATMIYASTGIRSATYVSLSTVGQLFSNILPVFIGLSIKRYCGDTLGTIIGAITLSIMAYGLTAVFSAELGSAISVVCTSIFILIMNVIPAKGSEWAESIRRIISRKVVS